MRARALVAAAVLLAAARPFLGTPASGGPVGRPPALPSLVIGYSAEVVAEVDPRDAKAATKLWADMIMRRKGATVGSEAVIYDSLALMEAALKDRRVDLVWLLPQDFLRERDRLPIVPVVISAPRSGPFDEFVLLVRSDADVGTVRGLRNRRLTVETDQKGALPLVWLETLLMAEAGAEEPRQFFSSVRATRRPSQTILPVFFRQADACIVTRSAFDTMAELNPQLRRELKPIASSSPYVAAVGCLRTDYFEKYGPTVTESLERLHEDPQGRQILSLFRKGKLVRFQASQLANVEGLLKQHERLKLAAGGRP